MALGASTFLFGSAAVLSGFGGVMHAAAFRKAVTAFAGSNLPHFYAGSSKGLWLADSATLLILAVIFGVVAVRPSAASRSIVMLVTLIPAATAVLLYTFLGGFYAGHLLLVISALAFFGGLQLRVPQSVGASGQRVPIVSGASN